MKGKVVRGKKRLQVQRPRKGTWTDAKREAFCLKLAQTCNVRASCRAVKMSEGGYYKLVKRDPEFRAQRDQAIAAIHFDVRLMVLKRQRDGVRRPVFHAGKKVGTITHYSDRVALALLRAHEEKAQRGADSERLRAQEDELARLRVEARLSEMNRRMGGEG